MRDNAIDRIRGWMEAPEAGTGVHLADDDGGWDFCSYVTLADGARRIAGVLAGLGIRAGDTVGVLMPTSHLCLSAMFAVPAAGATLTPIAPPLFHDPEQYLRHLAGVLASSQVRTVLTGVAFADTVARAVAGLAQPPRVVLLDDVPEAEPLAELAEPGANVLLQMTSGSTSAPRGAQIGWPSLASNLDAIDTACLLGAGDATASWLPLYHDMGLIGAVFQTITRQRDLYLMRPDQFVRDPARWLRAAAHARHTVTPPFGLAYAGRRLSAADIADIDLSTVRTVVVGAEPIHPAHLRSFVELTAARGFSPRAFLPSYGLAEATLIASAHRLGQPHRMVRIDRSALRQGDPVPVLEHAKDLSAAGSDWVVSVGVPMPGHRIRIAGTTVDGVLGEIVLEGESVFAGYRGDPDSATRCIGGELHTGDAGFLLDGELYVLGRMGTSVKVNGRSIFAEDLDLSAAAALGTTPNRVMTVAVDDGGRAGVTVFIEQPAGAALSRLRTALSGQVGADARLQFVGVPRGGLARTSSGKPRRAHMWQQWCAGGLVGAELLSVSDNGMVEKVRGLFEKACALAVIPEDATVHFEGSLAEGFGNEGSDIDLLLLIPGAGAEAVMPTVLFIDGHRVEIRAQSHAQVRTRLLRIRQSLDTGAVASEDALNRVQRFLRGTVLRAGPGYGELRDVVGYPELKELLSTWWQRRADQCLRQAAALAGLGCDSEAVSWAREGLAQTMKAFLAHHGEGYVEIKWLPSQMDRLRLRADARVAAILDDYRELDREFTIGAAFALAARMGGPSIGVDPRNVILRRVAGVTTWPVRSTTHVIRDKDDLFVLSAECAESWRQVVFGQSLAESRVPGEHLALFARLGLVALAWRGGGVITPVAAMCDPGRPLTPAPSVRRPVITIDGAPPDGPISRSPLKAKAFAEGASALILANMVLENAREDFDGAVKDGQWEVAALCGRRIVTMAVRILASAWGVTPLPGDPVLLHGLDTLVPDHPELATRARHLAELKVEDHDDASRALAEVDQFVSDVQAVTGGEMFPSSFASRTQWQETLRYGYQWLRMGGYLDAYVELDEARDLLASGGAQPSARAGGEQS